MQPEMVALILRASPEHKTATQQGPSGAARALRIGNAFCQRMVEYLVWDCSRLRPDGSVDEQVDAAYDRLLQVSSYT